MLQVLVTEGSITREVSRRRVRGKDLSACQGSTQIPSHLNCISTSIPGGFFVSLSLSICHSLSLKQCTSARSNKNTHLAHAAFLVSREFALDFRVSLLLVPAKPGSDCCSLRLEGPEEDKEYKQEVRQAA